MRRCHVGLCSWGEGCVEAARWRGGLQIFLYNVLSLVSPGRLLDIQQVLRGDAALLTGTRWRTEPSHPYMVTTTGKSVFINFGWRPGPYTSKFAGCAVLLGERWSEHNIVAITPAPAAIAGRGGVVRLVRGYEDWTIVVAYPPPTYGAGKTLEVNKKAARLTIEWVREQVARTPSRSLPLLGLDLNSAIGFFKEGRVPVGEAHVGPYFSAPNGYTGELFAEMLLEQRLYLPSTFSRRGGPTYVGPKGERSMLDHFALPCLSRAFVLSINVCWRLGRKLQLINTREARDHVPVLLKVRRDIGRRDGCSRLPSEVLPSVFAGPRVRWDYDALAAALQQGIGRHEFLEALEAKFVGLAARFQACSELPSVDEHWELWITALREVGASFFLKGGSRAQRQATSRDQS